MPALGFPLDLETVTPEIARHVLAHFGAPGGQQAGTYTTGLITLIARADPGNKKTLLAVYPGYATAVLLAQHDPYWEDRLWNIAHQDPT